MSFEALTLTPCISNNLGSMLVDQAHTRALAQTLSSYSISSDRLVGSCGPYLYNPSCPPETSRPRFTSTERSVPKGGSRGDIAPRNHGIYSGFSSLAIISTVKAHATG